MSFGWSASDVYTLLLVCHNVVENCREGLISASAQVKSLQEDVQEFSATLAQLQEHLSKTGEVAFLDLSEIKKSLDACNRYLGKYQRLQKQDGEKTVMGGGDDRKIRRRSSFSKSKELLDKSKDVGMKYGQVIKFSTWGGDQELRILQKKLSRHRQTLLLYIQILDRYVHHCPNSDP